MNEGEAIVQLVVAAGYDATTPGNHDRNYKYDRLAQINSVETADAAQPNAQIDALVAQLDSENTALLEQVLSQSEQGLLIRNNRFLALLFIRDAQRCIEPIAVGPADKPCVVVSHLHGQNRLPYIGPGFHGSTRATSG